jgi:FAD/FMN-containing dehydrogenase
VTRSKLVKDLIEIVGQANVLTDPELVRPYAIDWTKRWSGSAELVVRPASTDQTAEVVLACGEAGVAMIPQGGNTGLVGGSVPPNGGEVPNAIISLTRLNSLEQVDQVDRQLTVGAGVTLEALQDHLTQSGTGLAFAVDLAARGTATLGGMLATNAGGHHVIRYGSMRNQAVGVEAILPNGKEISRLEGLLKDNAGYDLPGLLAGSEGTLGIVTRIRLRLVPRLDARVTALIGVDATATCVSLVARMRQELPSLEAAEIVYEDGLNLVCMHTGLPLPLPRSWPTYLLIECAGIDGREAGQLLEFLESVGLPDGSTAVAMEGPGRQRLWAYRERHTETVNRLGVAHKLDVSVRPSLLAEFEAQLREVVRVHAPGSTLVLWGHVGDGNMHVNVVGPGPGDDTVDDAVLRLTARMGGSISAEHGIGRAKTRWLHLVRSESDIDVMWALKRALDPAGLLNPGVVLPPA